MRCSGGFCGASSRRATSTGCCCCRSTSFPLCSRTSPPSDSSPCSPSLPARCSCSSPPASAALACNSSNQCACGGLWPSSRPHARSQRCVRGVMDVVGAEGASGGGDRYCEDHGAGPVRLLPRVAVRVVRVPREVGACRARASQHAVACMSHACMHANAHLHRNMPRCTCTHKTREHANHTHAQEQNTPCRSPV
jgi:hypothetical protein